MYQTVHNIGEAFGIRVCFQDIEYIFQNRHFPIAAGIIRIIQAFIIVGDALFIVGLNQGFIQKLSFLMRYIRNQQGEENMQPLDFGCKL